MNKQQLFIILALIFVFSSCTYRVHTTKVVVPPGQAKKITGSQSAKPYAPGQQKKKGKTVVVVTNN
jgi:hypothetical protein